MLFFLMLIFLMLFFLMLINTKFEQVAREAPVYSLDALVADFGGTLRCFCCFFLFWGNPQVVFAFYSPRFHFTCLVLFLLGVVSFTAFMFSVSSLGSASWLSGTSCWLPCHGFKHWQERFLTKLSVSLERIAMHKKTHEREFACGDVKRKWQAENKLTLSLMFSTILGQIVPVNSETEYKYDISTSE